MAAVLEGYTTQLQHEVLGELAVFEKLDGTDIVAHESGGVVTLTGAVDCYARKLAAEEVVRGVPGVVEVINRIEIPADGFYGWRDIDIENAARQALKNHYMFAKRNLEVAVNRATIHLFGKVATVTERVEAERAVATIPNLRGIRNDLVVVCPGARKWL